MFKHFVEKREVVFYKTPITKRDEINFAVVLKHAFHYDAICTGKPNKRQPLTFATKSKQIRPNLKNLTSFRKILIFSEVHEKKQ